MPLTQFQADVFKIIAAHRKPESYVAGGIVINRDVESFRFSDDIDLFHETSQEVIASAEKDVKALEKSGYEVVFLLREPTFHQASVTKDGESLRLDWAADSAFRFFPIVPDEVLGFRLHDADAATNKVLAAIGRNKVRDFIDLMQLGPNLHCPRSRRLGRCRQGRRLYAGNDHAGTAEKQPHQSRLPAGSDFGAACHPRRSQSRMAGTLCQGGSPHGNISPRSPWMFVS
jgi:hypothetical protein